MRLVLAAMYASPISEDEMIVSPLAKGCSAIANVSRPFPLLKPLHERVRRGTGSRWLLSGKWLRGKVQPSQCSQSTIYLGAWNGRAKSGRTDVEIVIFTPTLAGVGLSSSLPVHKPPQRDKRAPLARRDQQSEPKAASHHSKIRQESPWLVDRLR